MKNACCYIRVSTHGKQEELSPDTQKKLIFEYCKKNGYIITEKDVFQDLGITGTESSNRTKFNEMIGHCKLKAHPYDAIIVWKFSRFARNQEESIIFKRMLKKNNVEVVSVSEPIPEGMMGELIERILEWMDEYYSINLSQEVMRGMTENAKRGKLQSNPPYGYRYDKKTKTVSAVEEEKEVYLKMIEMFEQGMAYSTIARKLTVSGYTNSNNSYWRTHAVNYIIDNPFYAGKVRWNMYSHRTKKVNDESEWIIADGTHEPFISYERYEKIHEKVKEYHLKNTAKPRTKATKRHYLSGILRCKCCGGGIYYAKHPKYPTFYCKNQTLKLCESNQYVSPKKMEEYFFEGIEKILKNDEYIYTRNDDLFNSRSKTELESFYDAELERIETKEKRIKQAYREGIDTIEEYKENKKILEKEKKEIEEKLNSVIIKIEKVEKPKEFKKKINDVVEILKDDNIEIPDKNEALKTIVSKIVFDKETELMEFHLNV